jgi:putative ABC transport system permease protein
MRRLRLRLRSVIHRRRLDRDLEEELRFHLDMLARDHADPQRQFGNYTGLKEACREMWTLGWVELWWQDIRYGLRSLIRNGGLTSVAVTALALGIGVNAAVFTLVNAILFKNLPFAHSDRILYVSSANRTKGDPIRVSYPDFLDFREQVKSFDAMGAAATCLGDLSDTVGFPQNYVCTQLTANSFSLLGLKPVAGRDFNAADEAPGAPPVVILTYGVWANRYGKDPAVIGRTVRINAVPATIIGVMGPRVFFPTWTELWLPLAGKREDRSARNLTVFGRLANGSARAGAQAELSTIAGRLAAQYPATNEGIVVLVQTFNEMALAQKVRSVFLLFLAAVGLVLMIACANVANLLLAKASGRAREISIRAALGAGRWRVIRQLLLESVMLALAGGALGWFLAFWGARAFDLAITPTGKPVWIDFSLDYRVLLYISAISIGTGLLFGLAPALRLSRLDLSRALKEGGRGSGVGLRGRFLSSTLVVVEMSLAVVLLAGAGLLLRGFLKLMATPVGVDTANVLTMHLELPQSRYPRPYERAAFYQRLKARFEAVPGVEVADVTSHLPTDGELSLEYEIAGAPPVIAGKRPRIGALIVGPDYFQVMQAPLLSGRAFTAGDGAAVVVNQDFAGRFWPHENPLGKQLRIFVEGAPHPWLTVVGVAPDIGQSNADFLRRDPMLYLPHQQEARPAMFAAARTRVPPGTLSETLLRTVQSMDPDLPVSDVITLDDFMGLQYRLVWVIGGMFLIFAAIAVLLASVGLYAVISHSVSQRTREIGVRMAMGATRAGVMRLIVTQGMRQLSIGLVVGLAAAFFLTRALSILLIGVSPTDPATFAAVSAVLILAGLLGCAVPARRAVRVDPAVTLRHE